MIIDTFMFNDEFDMLEMRLEEMGPAVDYFVLVEADVDHQNHPKPCHYAEHRDRFTRWADKIIDVQATNLPTSEHAGDPWAREFAQREWVKAGLARIPGLTADDIILHGDVDEICTAVAARNVRPKHGELISFDQTLHCFAVDWLHPDPWRGTVACTLQTVMAISKQMEGHDCGPFAKIRDTRNVNPCIPGGWHFSWMGGRDAALRKLGSFCHPEIADRTLTGLQEDKFLTEGFHVDGRRMTPVDVDETWPAMIRERRCPESWWRPR